MKSLKRMFALMMTALILIMSSGVEVYAATQSELSQYGFTVPKSGFTYDSWFNDAKVLHVYTNDGIAIGDCVTVVARARSTSKDSSGYYYDTLLVRSEMEPIVTKSGKAYYRGLNYKNQASTTLNSNQLYVNYAPTASIPTASSSWNVSFSGSADSEKKIGFSISTGYSESTAMTCYDVSANYYNSSKKYNISYDYKPFASIVSTTARKAVNKWCTQTHQCFYAFTYRTKSTNRTDMVIKYDVKFRYAFNSSSSWNYSPWDVILDSAGRSASLSLTYENSY